LLCSLGYGPCDTDQPTVEPPIAYPEQGTVLETFCSDTTYVEVIADGQGGEEEVFEENSEQCGYVPPPPAAGTLLREGCSREYPGVKWFQYADGEGGTYSEKDRKSFECGYSRTLTLTLEKESGDMFFPVVVKVEYINNRGEHEPWGMVHADTTKGYAQRVDRDTVHIYSDGRLGDGIFTLGREEIQYRIEEEPRCSVFNDIDCQGYRQITDESMIYYGEEDDHIVTWELGIMIYDRRETEEKHFDGQIRAELSELDPEWEEWEEKVAEYNEVYAKSGVHVRYELKRLFKAHYHNLEQLRGLSYGLEVDILLGHGISYVDTCGVAKVTRYSRENRPPVSMSKCDIFTDLHELGHSVGLAHGPENQSNQQNGYIFPQFGHGWNDICNNKDDLMSYGYDGIFHTNETLYCQDIFDQTATARAGGRQWTDTAYHLNRVRYEVALINDDNKYDDGGEVLQKVYVESQRKEIEVID